ncbi:MAG: hypothetical protein FWB93_01635 [Oscillospiraceae bacterium]|nr:hypothetical protein [Oscillospiraceae bacterium]
MTQIKHSRRTTALLLALVMVATMVFAAVVSPLPVHAHRRPVERNTLLSPFVPNNVSNFDISGFNGVTYNHFGRPEAKPGWADTSSAAYADAPFFHGAIAIYAPAGTTVDIRDAAFRTFAFDVFDGDISHNIQRTAPANPAITANTTITYEITNSRGTTVSIDVPVVFEADRTQFVVRRVVYSMPNADFGATLVSGQRDGVDQQLLGLYVMPNSRFEIRVVERQTGGGQTALLLYGYHAVWNGSPGHSRGSIGDNWQTVNHGNGTSRDGSSFPRMGIVPAIVTPRNDNGHSTIEVRFTLTGANSVRSINLFNYQDANPNTGHFYITEANWLAGWNFVPTAQVDDFGQMFAIIQSPTYIMMVAWQDRNDLMLGNLVQGQDHTRTGQGIQNILDNQEHMTHWFNFWYGLCINSANPWDRLVHIRQFTIPAYRGPGAAFMANRVLGMSGTNIAATQNGLGLTRYLRITTMDHNSPTMDFLAMHELGHRFDSNFGLPDVVTNVKPNFLQQMHRGHTYHNNRWNISPTSAAEQRSFANFESTHDTNLVRLLYTIESGACRYQAFQSINSVNREAGYRGFEWTRGDVFAYGIFRSSGRNVIPVIELYMGYGEGREISPRVRNHIMNSTAPIFNFLYPMMPGAANRAAREAVVTAQRLVGHWGAASLGATANTGLTATATINITSPDMASLFGQQLYIYDGETRVQELEITGQTVSVPAIPVGAYRVVLPRPQGLYTINEILLVSTNTALNVANVTYTVNDPFAYSRNLAHVFHGARAIAIEENPSRPIAIINNGNLNIDVAGTGIAGNLFSPDMARMNSNVDGFTANPNFWFGIYFPHITVFNEIVLHISSDPGGERRAIGEFVVEIATDLSEHPHENNSLDAEGWTVIASGVAGVNRMVIPLTFDRVYARYVRVRTVSIMGNEGLLPGISELQVFHHALEVEDSFVDWYDRSGDISFTVHAAQAAFSRVVHDETPVPEAYVSTSATPDGNTVITISAAFLRTLPAGYADLIAEFAGDEDALLHVYIPEPSGDEPIGTEPGNESNTVIIIVIVAVVVIAAIVVCVVFLGKGKKKADTANTKE